MTLRAALYARFSTDLQREASIDDQYRSCQRLAEQQSVRVTGRFEDAGISGGTAERPGYRELVAAAHRGEIDCIISEDISRLWRNRAEFGLRSTEFEDLGVFILTAVGDDTRRDGYMVLGIKLAIAEHQRREISFRTRRGMEGLALNGRSTGGRCYGYTVAGEVDLQEAEAVRGIFELRASGASLGQIVDYIHSYTGWTASRGGTWSRSSIQRILANARYTGAVIWGATESHGGARDSRLKKRRMRSEGPIVTAQDESKVIVSRDLWDRAQRKDLQSAEIGV